MATAAQIAATRRNAQHSTGPRTEEGKSASRMNSLQHGLKTSPTSTPWPPTTPRASSPKPVEERADWNLRRYRQLHKDTWEELRRQFPGMTDAQILLADLRGARHQPRRPHYRQQVRQRMHEVDAAMQQSVAARLARDGDETNPISAPCQASPAGQKPGRKAAPIDRNPALRL